MSMSKKILFVVVIILLVVAVICLGHDGFVKDEDEINEVNEEIVNEIEEDLNEVINETVEENVVEEENTTIEEEVDTDSSDEDTVQASTLTTSETGNGGTKTSNEEKAIELAKEYYEEEYGDASDIDFINDNVDGEGRYVVRVGTGVNGGSVIYLHVDLKTGTVSKK